jgi:transposase
MLFAKASAQEQETLLEELKQASDSQWYRRLKIIHLSLQRKPIPELAKLFDLCNDPVRKYVNRYNTGGLEALKRRSSAGAPPKLPLTRADWEELLRRSPSQFDRLQTGARNWTQELLRESFREYYGVIVAQCPISACIKRHGIRWNRGKLKVTSPDPLYIVKRKRIETLKKIRNPDVDQARCPKGGSGSAC